MLGSHTVATIPKVVVVERSGTGHFPRALESPPEHNDNNRACRLSVGCGIRQDPNPGSRYCSPAYVNFLFFIYKMGLECPGMQVED